MDRSKRIEEIVLAYPSTLLARNFERFIYENVSLDFIFNNPDIMIGKNIYLTNYNNILDYNDNFTLKQILDNLDKFDTNLDFWKKLTTHKRITMNDINDNPELPWEYPLLGRNLNVTEEMLDKYQSLIYTDYVYYNSNISLEYIKDNLHSGFKWCFKYNIQINEGTLNLDEIMYLLNNRRQFYVLDIQSLEESLLSLSFDEVLQVYESFPDIYMYVYKHKDITEEFVRSEYIKGLYYALSCYITNFDVVYKCRELEWDYETLCMEDSLPSIEDIKRIGLDKDWEWEDLSFILPLKDIDENSAELPWEWNEIWSRDDLDISFILKYYSMYGNQCLVYVNDNIILEEIENHPEINWKYNYLLLHIDINLDFINRNFQHFDFTN